MTRTQIQLPDPLYHQLKALSEAQEWSLAETLRRGAELLLRAYPGVGQPVGAWSLPEPVDVGPVLVGVEDLRALANQREPE